MTVRDARRAWEALAPRVLARRVEALCFVALVGFLFGYLPAASGLFRVEQWDIFHFYRCNPVRLLDFRSWGAVSAYNGFYLFRFLPAPGLWLYAAHAVLGDVPSRHLVLSLGLHFLNAVLLASWVGLWSPVEGGKPAALRRGAAAGCIFLLMPAFYESVVWTYYTYKLVNTALMLAALVAYELYLREERAVWAWLALALLFGSYMFLEATLPVGAVLAASLFLLRPGMSARRKAMFAAGVLATWVVYIALYFPCKSYALGALHMRDSLPSNVTTWKTGWTRIPWVGLLWAKAIILGNSGLPLTLHDLPYHVYTVPGPAASLRGFSALLLWTGIGALAWRGCPSRSRVAVALGLLAGASSLMLAGRFSEGWLYPQLKVLYLEGMSPYHYLPSVFLAALVGACVENASADGARPAAARGGLTVLVLMLLALYAGTLHGANKRYVAIQEPTIRLVEQVRSILRSDRGAKVYVDYHMPQAPVNNPLFTDEVHTFRAFSLLCGERVVPVPSLATVVVSPSGISPASRATAQEDSRRLIVRSLWFWMYGQSDDAARYARFAADADPASPDAGFYAGLAEARPGPAEETLAKLRDEVRASTASAQVHKQLAMALQLAGDRTAAEAEYREALGIQPDDTLAQEALKQLQEDLWPTQYGAYDELQKGLAFGQQGKWREAIEHTREAARLAPAEPLARNNLGFFLQQTGDIQGAIREYRKALELRPYFTLARANLDSALGRQALAPPPAQDPSALEELNKGLALSQQGRLREAIAHTREAIRRQPGLAAAHNNLGFFLQLTGDLEGAVKEYRRALELDPGFALARNNLESALKQSRRS